MSEKSTETLLPSIKEHMVTIPNDIQQLTIKDSTIFIGKCHSDHRLRSPCFGRLSILNIIFIIIIGIILVPTLYHVMKLIAANSSYDASLTRDMMNPLISAVNNAERRIASLPNYIFDENKLGSTANGPDVTILYSFRNPAYSLNEFYQFNSIYIARDYQTTLSFFIQNNQSITYLDDVSVKNNYAYASQMIVNGDFNSGHYGWDGLSSYSSYCSSSSYSYCASSTYAIGSTLSQTFNTTPGSVLNISFKLRWYGSGAGIFTKVIIYP